MRWLVYGYNVIRRAPELKSREQESLEAGREALCALLVQVARASADTFTVVFDGAQAGGRGGGGSGGPGLCSRGRAAAGAPAATPVLPKGASMLVGFVGTGNVGRPEVVGKSSGAKALRAGPRGGAGKARQLGAPWASGAQAVSGYFPSLISRLRRWR